VFPVEKLEEPWYNHHPKCKHFTASQVVRWGRMFSKLGMYALPYKRVVYLDTDTVVLRPLDVWFALPGEFYAERSPSHRGINAGIMVVRPSGAVLDSLIAYARENPPLVFWPSQQVGCTEQELLNRFWHCESASRKLNDTRHFDFMDGRFTEGEGREENRLHGARVAHCLTTKCNKPWDVPLKALVRGAAEFRENALQPYCDPDIYVTWHRMYRELHEEARRALFPVSSGDNLAPAGLRQDLPDAEFERVALQLTSGGPRSLVENAQVTKRRVTGVRLG
jgi:hypothetical protein